MCCILDVNCYLKCMTSAKRTRLTREESQSRTRKRLLESAAHEVARKGAGASVRDIAEAAGYSQGALYSNFESKELLLLELLRQHMEREVRELTALLEQTYDQPGGARAALDGWLETMNADQDWSVLSMELQMHAARDAAFAIQYDHLFADHRVAMGCLVERLFAEAGLVLPAPAIEIAGALMALAHGLVLQRKPMPAGTADPAAAMIRLMLKGLFELAEPQ
jgi:AcrR family transcriptional regulator